MDYMSILPSTKHGNDSVLVVVDRLSKMAIMAAYKKSITVEATTKLFVEQARVHLGSHIPLFKIKSKFLSAFWSSL